jgi:serine/threonine protein phosphatase PrpC
MVLACDGIWNFMSSQEVCDYVQERLDANYSKLSQICEELFMHCLAPDSHGDGTGCDNMTCIIVTFEPFCKASYTHSAIKQQPIATPLTIINDNESDKITGIKRTLDNGKIDEQIYSNGASSIKTSLESTTNNNLENKLTLTRDNSDNDEVAQLIVPKKMKQDNLESSKNSTFIS